MESVALSLVLVFLGSLIGSFGPILIKQGTVNMSFRPSKLIKNYKIIAGLFLYVLSVFVYIPALKDADLSLMYPMVSTTYIWVCLFSVKYLKERMNSMKWIGIGIIIVGIIFIGVGA